MCSAECHSSFDRILLTDLQRCVKGRVTLSCLLCTVGADVRYFLGLFRSKKRGRLESLAVQSFNKPVRNYCRMFFYNEVAECSAAILVVQSGSCYSVTVC